MNNNIISHIAFIMDGNRRWAKNKLLPSLMGHKAGARNIEKILKCVHENDIRYATFYTFSTENWLRPKVEIDGLFDLMREYISSNIEKFKKDDRFNFEIIGDIEKLPIDLQGKLQELKGVSKFKDGSTTAIFAINYGGKDEILRAVNKVLQSGKKSISSDDFKNYLDTKNTPDVDIIIRTGGEKRLSNFLIMQSSYAELYFIDTLWPDFSKKNLNIVLQDYMRISRNYGI